MCWKQKTQATNLLTADLRLTHFLHYLHFVSMFLFCFLSLLFFHVTCAELLSSPMLLLPLRYVSHFNTNAHSSVGWLVGGYIVAFICILGCQFTKMHLSLFLICFRCWHCCCDVCNFTRTCAIVAADPSIVESHNNNKTLWKCKKKKNAGKTTTKFNYFLNRKNK